MKFLVSFSLDPFYGEVSPIADKQALYTKVYDRTYLLGHLEGDKGVLRTENDFSENELLDIFKSVKGADSIHLVDSIEELRALSDDKKFQDRLVTPFVNHHLFNFRHSNEKVPT